MRLASLLIDFDDCGPGWLLCDSAAGISFRGDHPQVPALRAARVKGNRSERALPAGEEHGIDAFVMLRRLALPAWIGGHMEAPEPQALAPRFVPVSMEPGRRYLAEFA